MRNEISIQKFQEVTLKKKMYENISLKLKCLMLKSL